MKLRILSESDVRAVIDMAAAIDIQAEIKDFNAKSGTEPIVVKAGVHVGPCISVTLNERLDYFGGTVNMASRLQG